MNETIANKTIESMIYEVRGKQVMLDSDLAKLYECTNGTKDINKAVKRNLNRFPEDFCFQLTTEEFENLRFQNGTSSKMTRVNPHVFTEEGVAMLASVLKSNVASEISVKIIRAFVTMRKYLLNNFPNSNILINHENRILELEKNLNIFKEKQLLTIYDGKVYDAYSLLIDILKSAKKEIIVIDNYANKELFDILRNIDKKIYVISNNLDDILLKKYSSQYHNIIFVNKNEFHDRYIILDRKDVYISGMSLKDLGKRYSYIYKVMEDFYVKDLLMKIEIKLV